MFVQRRTERADDSFRRGPTFHHLSSQLLKAVLCSAAPKPIVDAHRDRKRCVARADVFFRLLNDERENTMKMLLHYDGHEHARHGHYLLFFDVLLDGCRGIELEPGDIARVLDEMKRVGAVLLKSSDL